MDTVASPFGSGRAARELAKIVERDPKLRRKITTLFSEYIQGLRVLGQIEPAYLRRRMYQLWFNEHDSKAWGALEGDVSTFTRNVLRGAYREVLRAEKDRKAA